MFHVNLPGCILKAGFLRVGWGGGWGWLTRTSHDESHASLTSSILYLVCSKGDHGLPSEGDVGVLVDIIEDPEPT